MMQEINGTNVDVILKGKKVIVDFWASWCGPCKSMSPIFEEMAGSFNQADITFAKCNVEEENANMELAKKAGVRSIPAFVLFVDGQPEKSVVGSMSKDALRDAIENIIPS